MSKSLGNSPDPLDLIAQYGADGVRMGMLLCSPAGTDILYDESLVEQGRNFTNKIWNAFRLVDGWEVKPDSEFSAEILNSNKLSADWFAGRLNEGLKDIETKYADYKLSEALMAIYKLIWDDFCAWYLEMIKPTFGEPINQSTYDTTIGYFEELMKILHPFMPFVTEEMWQNLATRKDGESICISTYPKVSSSENTPQLDRAFELITKIRELRNSKGLSPKEAFAIAIKAAVPAQYGQASFLIQKLANVSEIAFVTEKAEGTTPLQVATDEVYVHLNIEIDTEAEKEKLSKELEYLEGFLKSVAAKLANEKFVANAKPELVEKERQKQADAVAKIEIIKGSLASM
jgi:valyl-tRNA synthetase